MMGKAVQTQKCEILFKKYSCEDRHEIRHLLILCRIPHTVVVIHAEERIAQISCLWNNFYQVDFGNGNTSYYHMNRRQKSIHLLQKNEEEKEVWVFCKSVGENIS